MQLTTALLVTSLKCYLTLFWMLVEVLQFVFNRHTGQQAAVSCDVLLTSPSVQWVYA